MMPEVTRFLHRWLLAEGPIGDQARFAIIWPNRNATIIHARGRSFVRRFVIRFPIMQDAGRDFEDGTLGNPRRSGAN